MSRRAIIVTGAESSGTKVMTEALVHCGVRGEYGDTQPWDDLMFRRATDDFIVFRQTVPHATRVPNLSDIIGRLRFNKFEVTVICMMRDWDCLRQSMMKRGHVKSEASAIRAIQRAYPYIMVETTINGILPLCVNYEEFVLRHEFRQDIFARFGLDVTKAEAEMVFFNSNEEYDNGTDGRDTEGSPQGEGQEAAASEG